MIDLLRAIGEKSERAVRRSVWAFAGAGLAVLALGFAGAAAVEALAAVMPRYLALACGAIGLLGLAAFCFARTKSHNVARATAPASPQPLAAFSAGADWRAALNLALIEDARERPARAAALAALAGLILGALEGFEESQGKQS